MAELTYPRGYYEHQVKMGRPAGRPIATSPLQVRVEITEEELQALLADAQADAPEGSGNDTGLRLVAKGTCSRVRMMRQMGQLKLSQYSERG